MVSNMKKFINFISFVLVVSVLFSLAACKDNKPPEPDVSTTKGTKVTTAEPVQIVKIPEKTEDRVEMLNSALDYIDVYCYKYKKNVVCKVSNISLGELSKASNAGDAFKSIFGETDITTEHSYDTAPESFAANIIPSGFTADDVISADAVQDGDNIKLAVKFKNEANPSDKAGCLHKLSTDYLNTDKVKKNLGEFSSSAGSISVSAYDIVVTATLSTFDSSLKKLVVEYSENFSLGSVKLVQLEGSAVTGTSKTTVTYSDMG